MTGNRICRMLHSVAPADHVRALYKKSKGDENDIDEYLCNVMKNSILDSAQLRVIMLRIFNVDALPEPETMNLVFEHCYHLNDLPIAIRFMETIHVICHFLKLGLIIPI